MLFLTLFWLSLSRTYGDEHFFLKWTSLAKKSIFGEDQKPSPESVLYINVSGNISLLDTPDPLYQEYTGYHHNVITNRGNLSHLLKYINQYGEGIPLVVLDVSFEQESPDDSLFQASIDSLHFPILGASRLLEKGGLASKVIDLPTAVGNYLSPDNYFMKYPLYINDTFPTLPLAMLGIMDNALFKKTTFWPTVNGNISLSNPIVDFKIRPFDFKENQHLEKPHFSVYSLGTLLFEWEFWDEADIRSLLKNRLIIVGDFKEDIHDTVFGKIPGPVIVHNAYLTLKAKENLISYLWVLMFLILFWWMSYRMIQDGEKKTKFIQERWRKTAVGEIIADSVDEVLILAIATLASYFLFNIHVNILILLLYIKMINYFYVTLFQRWRF